MKIYSFPPIATTKSKILILGTMPGADSLKHQQYYAHPQNAFWKILFSLFDKPFSTDYNDRQELLLTNNIALWDMLQSCEREGSLDTNIALEQPNELNFFLNEHPTIQYLFFNGKQAERYFIKYINGVSVSRTVLPSTSPANTVSINKKLTEWQIIKNHIN